MRVLFIFSIYFFLYFANASSLEGTASKNYYANIVYSIQVGSFKSLENAWNLSNLLSKKGLDAFFFKQDGVYKVRFGNFSSADIARKQAMNYRKHGIISDFFIVNPKTYAINLKENQSKKFHMVRKTLVENAHSYMGTPYKWGGSSSSGFDCSGLARAVYRLNGLDLPRISQDQFHAGKFVLKANLQQGDLVFFTTNNGKSVNHVGIYIGNGEFIHAPGTGKTVTKAKLDSVYWKKAYKGARTYL